MVELKTNTKYFCDNCSNDSDITLEFMFKNDVIILCDDCLQELNRKIVKHLDDKNI